MVVFAQLREPRSWGPATLTLLTAAGASAQRDPTGIVKPACPPAATGQIILPIPRSRKSFGGLAAALLFVRLL